MAMGNVAKGCIKLVTQIAAMASAGMHFTHGHSPVVIMF
jgi:high-affinity nickel permease